MKQKFIPGLKLNKSFFQEIIKPLLNNHYPDLNFSAALIGYGSDVLGFDTAISMDHNWGPRCLIFLDQKDFKLHNEISDMFSKKLPFIYHGFSTNFSVPRNDFTQTMMETNDYPIKHLIEVHDVQKYLKKQLKINDIYEISINKWIDFNDQLLLELTAGEVFYDGLNLLESIRSRVQFYPDDIWKIRLASLWKSIESEEAFVGRAKELNDVIGIKLISSRIVNFLMKICFYIEKKYIPYSKWFGTAFNYLAMSKEIIPLINEVLLENKPESIEKKLCNLYVAILKEHNKNNNLPFVNNHIQNYYGRPYKVIYADKIVETLLESISDKKIKKLDLNQVAKDIKFDALDFTE